MHRHASRQTQKPAPPVVHEALRASAGRPLDPRTRELMESRFVHDFSLVPAHADLTIRPAGDRFEQEADRAAERPARLDQAPRHDFSDVRLHTDARAASATRAVAANAFTVGPDVFFAEGRYAPQTERGQKLLAHELTHVVQQAHAPAVQRDVLDDIGAFFGVTEGAYTKEELAAYLRLLSETRRPEGSYDSDNKARVVVRVWKTGDRALELNAELKKLLVREMWEGYTSEGDQDAILDVLDRSTNPDLETIFGAGGVTPEQLLGSFDDDRKARLETFLQRRFRNYAKRELNPAGDAGIIGQLNDKAFREKWEQHLEAGLKLLSEAAAESTPEGRRKDESEIGCAFPEYRTRRFDTERWTELSDPLELQGSYRPNEGTPHEAVDGLFANLTLWTCDCGRYVEVAWLYAWRRSLPDALFDRKFARLTFRWEGTTGMERERLSSAESEPEADLRVFGNYATKPTIEGLAETEPRDVNERWESLPVGTRVVWKNHACIGNSSWERENAIKTAMGGKGKPALYDAHPFPRGRTEEQVKRLLAAGCPNFPRPHLITGALLARLKSEFDIPPEFLEELRKLEGKPFASAEELARALPARKTGDRRLLKELFVNAGLEGARQLPVDEQAQADYVRKHVKRDAAQIPM